MKQKLELTWVGKDNPPNVEPRILLRDKNFDYGETNSENILIHGDNLLALKSLEQESAITTLGNKYNGLLATDVDGKTRANANSNGVTPEEILQNFSGEKSTTATEEFSNVASSIKNMSSMVAYFLK